MPEHSFRIKSSQSLKRHHDSRIRSEAVCICWMLYKITQGLLRLTIKFPFPHRLKLHKMHCSTSFDLKFENFQLPHWEICLLPGVCLALLLFNPYTSSRMARERSSHLSLSYSAFSLLLVGQRNTHSRMSSVWLDTIGLVVKWYIWLWLKFTPNSWWIIGMAVSTFLKALSFSNFLLRSSRNIWCGSWEI